LFIFGSGQPGVQVLVATLLCVLFGTIHTIVKPMRDPAVSLRGGSGVMSELAAELHSWAVALLRRAVQRRWSASCFHDLPLLPCTGPNLAGYPFVLSDCCGSEWSPIGRVSRVRISHDKPCPDDTIRQSSALAAYSVWCCSACACSWMGVCGRLGEESVSPKVALRLMVKGHASAALVLVVC
jgi:hypothetical protein